MPLLGNQASAHPMSPATQVSITDATATFGGGAALSAVYPGAVSFTTAGDSISLPLALLGGNSVIAISAQDLSLGPTSPPAWTAGSLRTTGRNAYVTVQVTASGLTSVLDQFYWRPGEFTFYETYRVTGEYVTVNVVATETGSMVFNLNLYVVSV